MLLKTEPVAQKFNLSAQLALVGKSYRRPLDRRYGYLSLHDDVALGAHRRHLLALCYYSVVKVVLP